MSIDSHITPHARFAVRSSGIGEDGDGESFAGIHQTFLDVRDDVPAAAAARRLRSGDRVGLDAINGLVQRLTPAPAATAPACAGTIQEQTEIAPARVHTRKAS